MVVFGQNWFYSGKSGWIGTKWLYLEKKLVVFGKSECIRKKWLNSGKDVLFEQNG